jgi:RNA polymerase sigma factor (TIGR02999 family)
MAPKLPFEPAPRHEVTDLLAAWRGGDPAALDRLMPLLYDELRRIAAGLLRRESSGHTLQPTALVHEAYLRLVGQGRAELTGKAHFLSIAARMMRRILVDHARAKQRAKRGGGETRVELTDWVQSTTPRSVDLLALDAALDQLEGEDETKARVVELRYFGGLTVDETAAVLGSSPATVKRHWSFAQAWLVRALGAA